MIEKIDNIPLQDSSEEQNKYNGLRCRKWLVTINNPQKHHVTAELIRTSLLDMKSLQYYCMSEERGLETNTPHFHIFLYFKNQVRFERLKKVFYMAHINKANGSVLQNKDYVAKTGAWEDDPKAKTKVEGTFFEWGEIPEEPGQGHRSDIEQLYQMIDDGMSNAQIMQKNPKLALHINRMDKIRLEIIEDKYKDIFRNLKVVYIWGATETGKTRGIMDKHGYRGVYRITDYNHPFDRYCGEHVVCFDEFRSNLPIGDMLQYLDGYPISLPARYANRAACYDTVYIVSNISLREQYPEIQNYQEETWKAFLRRIHQVIEYAENGILIDHGSGANFIS